MVFATKSPREDANAEDEAACGRHTSNSYFEDVLLHQGKRRLCKYLLGHHLQVSEVVNSSISEAGLSSINYEGGVSYPRSEVVDGEDQIRFLVNLHICKGVAGCCYSRNMHHEL
ncbi:unnamed protein product [Brassica oleracea var. botrytis]